MLVSEVIVLAVICCVWLRLFVLLACAIVVPRQENRIFSVLGELLGVSEERELRSRSEARRSNK